MAEDKLYIRDSRTSVEYEIPIRHNAISASSFKVIKLQDNASSDGNKTRGLVLYDPGLTNTAITESAITWTDATKGLIMFRGYTPEQLHDCDFEDAVCLLVWGHLPGPSHWRDVLRTALAIAMAKVPQSVFKIINSFPTSSPPLPMVLAGLAACNAASPESMPAYSGINYHKDQQKITEAIITTLASFAVVVGATESRRKNRDFTAPSLDKGYYWNLFTMMGFVNPSTGTPDPLHISCMRRWGNAIMDHGLANSTFALRVAASTLADPISAIISALAAASGPLHFGAQEAGFKTLMMQVHSPDNVPTLMEKVKKGEHRLHGFGHRTFKGTDPRVARVLGLLGELGATNTTYFKIAKEIERIAAEDEWFLKRGLYPNADLYGQFFYVAIGMDPEWSPIMVFLQRLPGLMAHWREVMSGELKLIRPADLYVGPTTPKPDIPSKI